MTREEVEKIYGDVYEGYYVDKAICNHCQRDIVRELSSFKKEMGTLFFLFSSSNKITGRSRADAIPPTTKYYVGNEVREYYPNFTFSLEAFCSKECFINYIYDHQAEIIELITQ